MKIYETIDEATDELAEALADFDSQISPDDLEAYDAMRDHVEQAQRMLLELLKINKNEKFAKLSERYNKLASMQVNEHKGLTIEELQHEDADIFTIEAELRKLDQELAAFER